MNLRQIEIFHAVMQAGSLNQAAKRLNVSQPTLSQALKHAEDQLGYLLFNRVKGRLVPTREAELLFVHAEGVMRRLTRFTQISDNLHRQAEMSLTIGAVPALHFHGLPQVVDDLAASFPNLGIALRSLQFEEAGEALTRKKIDAALLFCPGNVAGPFKIEPLAKAGFEVLSRVELPLEERSLEKVCTRPDYISIAASGPLGELLDRRFARDGISIRPRITTETYYSSAVLAQAGTGVAIVDSFTAHAFAARGLHAYPLDGVADYDVGLVYPEDTGKSEIIRFLCESLRRHLVER
ncbi:LysR family transcriptional regulator [Aestuariispira insulae]|uniref:DNA-binding transcriptional LysR family regulator n=1 Tax=Aestuariispira insulae TaxID=1461337 RepID=A0A3D9HSB3_9PROT|nr:LysR family transcriptional regulator [Aestuariispira insulae]RED52349.1 DNA-binding transcriptional LysR family regulator [Aestuariispira insulae]